MAIDVMAIGAHPDDVEIGMGGTIAALTKAGKSVVLVDLSDGEPTPHGTHELRMTEAAAAAKALGVTQRITLDITNREIFDTVENRKKLAAVIREYKPKTLFIPYWEDGHPDHIEASSLAIAARFYAKFVKTDLPFEPHYPYKFFHYITTHIAVRFMPSFIFDISESMETKLKALTAYQSQFAHKANTANVFEKVSERNRFWGEQIKKTYGEPFVCKENINIHDADALLTL